MPCGKCQWSKGRNLIIKLLMSHLWSSFVSLSISVSCSLSASTLSCSSGSSRGSLTSSRGSLATTSSLGSTSSLSFTDLYLEQPELADPDFQNKLDSLLQESSQGGYRPSSSITTIHEHEVVTGCGRRNAARPEAKTGRAGGDNGCSAGAGGGGGSGGGVGVESSRIQALRLSETPRSMSSLSPRSSLSSLSPPCSPLVTDTSFLSGETFGCQTEPGGLSLDLELQSRLAELELSLDSQEQLQEEHRGPRGLEEKQNLKNKLGEDAKGNLSLLHLKSSHTQKHSGISEENVDKDCRICLQETQAAFAQPVWCGLAEPLIHFAICLNVTEA